MKSGRFSGFPSAWKGKIAGSVFGILAGPFGVILGFLIGHLVDYICVSGAARRKVSRFLEAPADTSLPGNEEGKYSFFCLGLALSISSGSRPRGRGYSLHRRLSEYYPLEKQDAEYLRSLLEEMDSFLPAPDLRAHAQEVLRLAKGESEEILRQRLLNLYVGLLWFAEGPSVPSGSLSALILRCVSRIWNISPADTGIEEEAPSAEENPWRVLGLPPHADKAEVKKVFRMLASQFHPDRGAELSDIQRQETTEAFRRIRKAYEICMNMR
ncbi:MAG: DnaJ domain-containing protein [Spirochaetales bacterium]|jgi:hypothetical protein|nr:DnaJ domain-containing protein [Spirochaetales bacterium]